MVTNILQYLERTASKYPDKTSFRDSKSGLTFSELTDTSKRIGSYLAGAAGIGTNKPVIVLMEKVPLAVAAFMGAVYAGCFYVPVDEKMPRERFLSIVDTLSPGAVIYSPKTAGMVKDIDINAVKISIEDACNYDIREELLEDIRAASLDTDLLYVLFTSGSTGNPKGVTISHRAVIDFMESFDRVLPLDHSIVFGNQAAFYFDLSVLDLYSPLRDGSTTVIIPKKCFLFPKTMAAFIKENEINAVYWVPSALVSLANSGILETHRDSFEGLKKIYFCGEVMPVPQLNMLMRAIPGAVYANMYGPTETTNSSTYYIVDGEYDEGKSLPIGKAFPNTGIHLLREVDGVIKRALPGEMGEIAISGSGLSYGYYNAPDITAKSFIKNPLNNAFGEMFYLTGDLGRFDENGDLIFCGRKDYQIKHLGYRIELGDIEAGTLTVNGILEAVCNYDDKRDVLVLYYIGELSEDELRTGLKKRLQEYMIPEIIIRKEAFPRNANGKTDKKALSLEYLENQHD